MKYIAKMNTQSARHPETAPGIIYFAYGSNMDIAQMEERCPEAVLLGRAALDGYELAFDTAGYLTVVENTASHVQGALWAVSEVHVKSLDRYEGVASDCYRKEFVSVSREAMPQAMDALAYISNRTPVCYQTRKLGYISRVVEAARVLDLDEQTQAQLAALRAQSFKYEQDLMRGESFEVEEDALRKYAGYVCDRCGHALPDCTCDSMPWRVSRFDCDFQEMCRVLGQKRYQVTGVCGGAFCESHRVWVEFKCGYKFGVDQPLPEGFKLVSRDGRAVLLASIPYALSFEGFEARRQELLASLRSWVAVLPEFTW